MADSHSTFTTAEFLVIGNIPLKDLCAIFHSLDTNGGKSQRFAVKVRIVPKR